MDLKQIKSLVQLMIENDLTRMELREGDTHILLKRGGAAPHITYTAPLPMAPAGPALAAGSPAVAGVPTVSVVPALESREHVIRSPMVGTFYPAPDPESAPFVKVGDEVTPDTVVCLVEAMKVYNEIKAEVSGRVTKVLAKNAQAVEFDQPLFAVLPAE